LDYLL